MATLNPDLKQPFAQWEEVDVTFPTTPNTDCTVQHSLTPGNPEDIYYFVVRKGQAMDVYHDTSGTRRPWLPGVLYLRSTVGGASCTLLLRVSHKSRNNAPIPPPV